MRRRLLPGRAAQVAWTATALVVDMMYDSANLLLTQFLMFLFFGQTLNELARHPPPAELPCSTCQMSSAPLRQIPWALQVARSLHKHARPALQLGCQCSCAKVM